MTSDDLKPCPFCPDGGKPKLFENVFDLYGGGVKPSTSQPAVVCMECGIIMKAHSKIHAKKKWNTRNNMV